MKVTEVSCQHSLSGIGRYGVELSSNLYRSGDLKAFYKPYKEGHPDSWLHDNNWVEGYSYRSLRDLHPYIFPFYVKKALKKEDHDLIHAHWFMSGLAASAFRKIPKIITMHDVSLLHLPEQNKRYINYYRWAINRFKKLEIPIIVVSDRAKQDAIRYANYPEHLVHVIYNGINHEQFFQKNNESLRPNDTFRIIYSGGLGKRKNVGLLLKAFKIVEEKRDNVELVISGGHPERTEYPGMANRAGIKNIRFTGFIDDDKMSDFYRSGHLMVFTSEYEGFGMAPLEAMASGTPVLSSKGGALQETSGNGAQYFDYDADDLASQIIDLYDNSARREELTHKGKLQASKYSWEESAALHLKVYRSIV